MKPCVEIKVAHQNELGLSPVCANPFDFLNTITIYKNKIRYYSVGSIRVLPHALNFLNFLEHVAKPEAVGASPGQCRLLKVDQYA